MKLIDFRTHDGSRHFARLPKKATWDVLRRHISQLPGLLIQDDVSDTQPGPSLSFSFRGHQFVIHNGGQEYNFYVRDPRCSDLSLFQLAYHCERLLDEQC
jgi:hypothetical protein